MDRGKSGSASSLPEPGASPPPKSHVRIFQKNFSMDQVGVGVVGGTASLPDSPQPETGRGAPWAARSASLSEADKPKSSSVTCLSGPGAPPPPRPALGGGFTPATRGAVRAKSSSVSALQDAPPVRPAAPLGLQQATFTAVSQSLRNLGGDRAGGAAPSPPRTGGGSSGGAARAGAGEYVVPPLPTTAMRQQQLREQQQQQQQQQKVSRWGSVPDTSARPRGGDAAAPPAAAFSPQRGVARWSSVPDSMSQGGHPAPRTRLGSAGDKTAVSPFGTTGSDLRGSTQADKSKTSPFEKFKKLDSQQSPRPAKE